MKSGKKGVGERAGSFSKPKASAWSSRTGEFLAVAADLFPTSKRLKENGGHPKEELRAKAGHIEGNNANAVAARSPSGRGKAKQAKQQENSPHPSPGFLWARPSKKKQRAQAVNHPF